MRILQGFRVAAFSAVVLAFTAVNAHADDFIFAYGWTSTEAIVNSATGASAASLALGTCHNGAGACTHANADVTFTTSGVNFSGSGLTIAAWIGSNTFAIHNLVDSAPGSLMDPTIWEFTGNISVTSPNAFTIQHDDGATFVVNGQTVINAPGPTAPVVTGGTYTGAASSSVAFDLIYAECCGGPAVLSVSLLGPANAPVPEPGSILLLSSVLAGIAFKVRRKRLG
ncbi:MAG: PEP-CTERM sorting domain-containing protein [Candidatus Solibacter sp.]|nr:PEP-CTERM sorting domain-containing protein [Candidatus Solibacter sp.]